MLIKKDELKYDFQGAVFDLKQTRERTFLAWVFNQFLYGEVTGIQCGYWLYHAPHLNAAAFLAKQASEELSHVRRFLRILSLMGEKPASAHWAIRFLSTGMMGSSWGEHVALEMAMGEGLVLSVFYALVDTIDDPEIHRILESSCAEEERHVEFGEKETRLWLERHPKQRRELLGSALIQLMVLQRLKGVVVRSIAGVAGDHPVLSQFGGFYDHILARYSLRIERLGLSDRPLSELGTLTRFGLVARVPIAWLRAKVRRPAPLLTSTYLNDPLLIAEIEGDRLRRSSPSLDSAE